MIASIIHWRIKSLIRCNRWSLWMSKLFHPPLCNGFNNLCMLGLTVNHVSKGAPCCLLLVLVSHLVKEGNESMNNLPLHHQLYKRKESNYFCEMFYIQRKYHIVLTFTFETMVKRWNGQFCSNWNWVNISNWPCKSSGYKLLSFVTIVKEITNLHPAAPQAWNRVNFNAWNNGFIPGGHFHRCVESIGIWGEYVW